MQHTTLTLVVLQSQIDLYLAVFNFYFLLSFYAFIYFIFLPRFSVVLRVGLCSHNQ